MQNTHQSNSCIPPISSFALSFYWQLPQDWKPDTLWAENLMGLMESLLMAAHGALLLPPSSSVLQHRWYLIPFAPQWYMWIPAMQFCEGIKGRLQRALEPVRAEMRWMSTRRKWCSCCTPTETMEKWRFFFFCFWLKTSFLLPPFCPTESQRNSWSAPGLRTARHESQLVID